MWVVSELYYPEETSTGYYLTRIAEGLADKFEVKAICGQPNYSARGTKAPAREIRNGVEIYRATGSTLDKNVIVFRLINMITLSISVLILGVTRFRAGDRVLVVTTPPAMPFVVALASLTKGASYTLLIHDNYPEILIAAGKTSESSLIVRSLDRLNRWLYKHAARIIVCGRDMKELMTEKTAGLDIPIDFVPNWAELETVSPRSREANELLRELGVEDKFVLLYAGNMGWPNDMESIVEAAEILMPTGKFHFIFLGTGAKRPWLEREVNQRALTNVSVLQPRPRTDQIVFLNACDVSLVSLVDKMLGVSTPSRTYNILAAGRPLIGIAQPTSEVARVIAEERVGWTVSPGRPKELVDAITSASEARSELSEMGLRARIAAETKYSRAKAIKAYQASIN